MQSISIRDLNPLGASYTTLKSGMGIETKVGSGGTVFAKIEDTK